MTARGTVEQVGEMSSPLLQTFDGVGCATRGDVMLILYAADARLHRTKWVFDQADAFAARSQRGILALIVITPGAAPPDAATRTENGLRFKQVAPAMRRLVTVATGDSLFTSVVRTIMRAMVLVQGYSAKHVIVASERLGIEALLDEKGPETPPRAQLETDLRALYSALEVRAA